MAALTPRSISVRVDRALAAEPPTWEGYFTARLITKEELLLLQRFGSCERGEMKKALMKGEGGKDVFGALLTVLKNVSKAEALEYVLAEVYTLVDEDMSVMAVAHAVPGGDPYTPFLHVLQREEVLIRSLGSELLGCLIATRGGGAGEEAGAAAGAIASFLDWISGQLRRRSSEIIDSVVHSLATLLADRSLRPHAIAGGCASSLPPLLHLSSTTSSSSPPSYQFLYDVGLCIWLLSFSPEGCKKLHAVGVLRRLTAVAKGCAKEKVVRVVMLSLRNLLEYNKGQFGPELADLSLGKIVYTLKMGAWKDEELLETLDIVEETMATVRSESTTFDKYKREVLSGSLDWTPIHTDVIFWKECVEKFEERDWQILRVLLKLIEAGGETKTLAVACHDVGQFLEHHPDGRYIVQHLSGKEAIMKLMAHPDPEVQKQSLLCIQKMMLSKATYDFLATDQLVAG